MSGLDGLGWPNPEDEQKPKETMNSQLEIKLAPTLETDQCVKANKHLRFLQEDHYVGNSKTTYENPIVFLSRKLERERDEARETCSELVTDSDAITLARTVVRITQDCDEAREHVANLEVSLTAAIRSANMCQDEAEKATAGKERLERERDVAQKAMGDVRDVLLDAMPDANAPTKILAKIIVAERDSNQEQADALVARLGATQERMINAERERDKLLKELNVLSYWRDISECDCHNPLPNGGCLRCDLDKVFNSNQQPK